ncbi:RelA/SpoT family protein [Ferrimicrobium acidiphilum]|jgi:GTP pyrophosphokinase|uniref:Bifunctional (P)ppGpp synthase/hydrolase RelA n=3 Tax=Ferrimicrobium acidiphilum TaxID=121039 RepID=A0A0D8FXI1_9ACTN|nr:bifunctional (p)ppGpp synthetase/guanosine-3',5'-bis(diphosphate) 3'-pyrophosphohydrolase [Ferrimicrobium acidiphilum]KJE77920.1 bifunctional (p)ppGpp synthase/hydrolase RelA [Ferrimicrobium acidiphilum DSM 19497]MCL5053815.1 bifunctional (p)ppGpp synthetase/guanosine-3',5'-bis(diphosphate) 3'-pyrophosphohydrolase [Gammaproteobacteria bacterium]
MDRDLQSLLDAMALDPSSEASATIERALEFARLAHDQQRRRSGEPYVTHPIGVALITASLGGDLIAVVAALLHDTVEDTPVTLTQIGEEFSTTVAEVVDGLTKLDRISFDSREAQQAATMRKMLIAMAKDARVLVIKLADRLHNMRTIAALPVEKQRRIAQETMDIYAPLANRLGIEEMKWQLEDLAFATLHPRRYAEIDHMIATRAPERELYLAEVTEELRKRLALVGIDAEVNGRPKHLWSIYEKMIIKDKDFDSIYDIIGVRIVTESDRDCWAALGVVHSLWAPIPGRFKDYINAPKFNLYQSLHTTVLLDKGNPLEVQVRTREMHRRAEFGIAAHWGYKEGSSSTNAAWVDRLMELQEELPDPLEFLEHLKSDLEMDEVYVFTPKGKVVTLPVGATPLDFAYSIHTEVGHRCIGAKVNGRLVPLESTLRSGDTVEIVSSRSSSAAPSRDWLSIVVTPRAKAKIRQWFSRERREESIEIGRDELTKAFRRENLAVNAHLSQAGLAKLAKVNGLHDGEGLLVAVGEGHVSARAVAQRVQRNELETEGYAPTVSHQRPRRMSKGPMVYVEGMEDVLVRISRCCNPIPGDEIVGFITQGRGVGIHRADCPNVLDLLKRAGERRVEVEWAHEGGATYQMAIEVLALDRARLLADVSKVLSEHHVNITMSSTRTGGDHVSRMRFEFELVDPGHLSSVLGAIRQLDGVFNAYRMLPGGSRRAPGGEQAEAGAPAP